MRIDLHTHAKWSKDIDFSFPYYQEMMLAAGRSALDAVALTEHFNTRRFYDIYNELDRHCTYDDDHYRVGNIKVFPGIEVDAAEGAHILLIGSREHIVAVRERLEAHTENGKFMGAGMLLELADEFDCLRIGAHPYRAENLLTRVESGLLRRFDALDLNGRDLHHYGRQMEKKVRRLARRTGWPAATPITRCSSAVSTMNFPIIAARWRN